ncbi:MAG TPA: hydroxysqualene dehydroxylase HpnE [Casimicrobiaceae bacterium]|nr:hydroxysqualene dehydroxylase HpnE [Casimicrobiaceae bacterium]
MRAAIIGGGWAGCAAAVTFAQHRQPVTVFESADIVGGRARRVTRHGLALDNGQHLLLGAYRETCALLSLVDPESANAALRRSRLVVEPLQPQHDAFRLRAAGLRAPFGLLAGLLMARGLSIAERARVIGWFTRLKRNGFRCPASMTVADLLSDAGDVATRELWAPLCLAALNTPVDAASATIFLNVLRASFADDAQASDFLLPTTDLSALFPETAMRYVETREGRLLRRTTARVVAVDDAEVVVEADGNAQSFDAVVVAVGPHQFVDAVADLLPVSGAHRSAAALAYQPIATVWLGFASRFTMPSIARLDDAPGQWIIDRPDIVERAADDASRPRLAQVVAIVISADGPHAHVLPSTLVEQCDAQLRRLTGDCPPLAFSQMIIERRATYACVPNRPRPSSALPHPRLALAGDWIDAEFPATLEAAVRTGVNAAEAILASAPRYQVTTIR